METKVWTADELKAGLEYLKGVPHESTDYLEVIAYTLIEILAHLEAK